MDYEITTQRVEPALLAAVPRRVRLGEVRDAWKPALDGVWAFLRRHEGLRTDGHNVFVYRHPARRDAPMEVLFGVEVTRAFDGEGEVVLAQTPSGEVATTRHIGPYDALPRAHDAVHAWLARTGRASAGVSWETYGDWSDDPARLETRVTYLLA